MAIRPDQGVLPTIASAESSTNWYCTRCFAAAGRVKPQKSEMKPAATRTETAATANNIFSRRSRFWRLPVACEIGGEEFVVASDSSARKIDPFDLVGDDSSAERIRSISDVVSLD